MLLRADISFNKFNNLVIKKFLSAYTGNNVPDDSTLIKNVAPKFDDRTNK